MEINELAEMQRDRGKCFEYLALAYFQNEPTYQNEFKNVWILADVLQEFGIPKVDTAVDLVAEKFTGELVAIQEKFYTHAISKKDIASFLGELGKTISNQVLSQLQPINGVKMLKKLYQIVVMLFVLGFQTLEILRLIGQNSLLNDQKQ